ncbi:MAG: lytic transglycosylase domain-containing protein [Flavobacteriales bacterium]|nr:lytic transglycosylase domain-containing protein [Flavobacteriales bacterium]
MKNQKLIYSLAVVIILFGGLKLFSFSSYNEQDDAEHQDNFNASYKVFSLNIPKNMNFSGESVPIQNFDVREKLDRELLVNTYWQSQSILFQKRAKRWFAIIEPILERNGIPADFKYLAIIESGLTNIVSPAGATGFWQIMKSTGKEYGLEITQEVDERYHVEKSTEAACKYLTKAYNKFGNWTLAAASYNMGMHGLSKQLKRQKVTTYYDLLLNEETARYLYRILAVKEILSTPEKYGFQVREKDKYQSIETYKVVVDSTVTDFADYAYNYKISYKTLKIFNPWLRQAYLNNDSGKKYSISIPKDTALVGSIHRELLPDSINPELIDTTASAPQIDSTKVD